MENRKGSSLFLGVVSVATLVVAIIGATFAWFSVNVQSDDEAVQAGAYSVELSALTIERVGSTKSLIPLDPTVTVTSSGLTNLMHAVNVADPKCQDAQGYGVCVLYKVTVTNQAPNAVTLTGVLKTTDNGTEKDFTNLMYQGVTESDGTFTVSGDAKSVSAVTNSEVVITNLEVSAATVGEDGQVTTAGTGTAYVLLYLNDSKESDEQNKEMGATFKGQLVYSLNGENKLTGTFDVQ